MTKRNLGVFTLALSLVKGNPEAVAEAFSIMKCVPLRVEYLVCQDELQYMAISEKFDELPEGAVIPEYKFLIKFDEDNKIVAVEALRV